MKKSKKERAAAKDLMVLSILSSSDEALKKVFFPHIFFLKKEMAAARDLMVLSSDEAFTKVVAEGLIH